ncbi:hypothetical protein K503DRAFT_518788 [Rhizopogon vinicolor AM-OR11-026]|uniref:Uncharacterized protein n=1 Tax=Rhizopogon vinicolor AM-OR11-026 TaxID=1314800 RepID=A0A1B7MLN7_9AGAM|nr:hypothetical protein K503DRAFT_518788 [Rhizopogon vinicolor AM-OR11-026]
MSTTKLSSDTTKPSSDTIKFPKGHTAYIFGVSCILPILVNRNSTNCCSRYVYSLPLPVRCNRSLSKSKILVATTSMNAHSKDSIVLWQSLQEDWAL